MATNDDDWLDVNEELLAISIDDSNKALKVDQSEADGQQSGSKDFEDEFCVLDTTHVETLDKAVDAAQFVEMMIQDVDTTQRVETMDKAVDATQMSDPCKEADIFQTTHQTETSAPVEVAANKIAPKETIRSGLRSQHQEKCSELEKAMDRAAENLAESLNRVFNDFVGNTPP
jgi:hypothetical protein